MRGLLAGINNLRKKGLKKYVLRMQCIYNITNFLCSRYVTRRPARSKFLAERARQLTLQRTGDVTTDDDISVLKLGRYWPKSERKNAAKQRKSAGDSKKGAKLETSKSLDLEDEGCEKVVDENDIIDEDTLNVDDTLDQAETKDVLVTVMTV